MKFTFHNKLTIKLSNKNYEFYNTMLNSTLEALSNFDSYNKYISIGNGEAGTAQNNFHLTNYLITSKLDSHSFQSNISKGNLFAIYEYKLLKHNINSNFIKEVGLSDNNMEPTIYNYFSLVSDENPDGLDITNSEEILFKVTINLNINENNDIILTSGNNPFIEFLLGNGLDEIYSCLGSNYSNNTRISRIKPINSNLIKCSKNANLVDNLLNITFSCQFKQKIDEILFLTNDKVFARKNLKEYKNLTSKSETMTAKDNYVIKINSDIKNVASVINNSTNSSETNYLISKYANSIGDEINNPFNNLFNFETTKYISKDGKLVLFILNGKVYCYKNENFEITQINTREITDDEITKIISFENYIFIISKIKPFISTYIISDNVVKKINNNFENLDNYSEFETLRDIDITHCENDKFIAGILTQNGNALSIYFDYSSSNGFIYSNYLTNSKVFNYVIAMLKNNFCDGRMIYLKEGSTSAECRIVTHSSSAQETDIYSYLAYALTLNSKRIYCKGRALISEKTTSPTIVIYYYPQVYEYKLSLIQEEIKDYISEDIYYIAQENENKIFKLYNLVGYDTPEEFTNNLSDFMNCETIQEIVFLKDSFFVFTNNENQKIKTFNLNLNNTQIENVSDKDASYLVSYNEYNKLGSNDETVTINFKAEVTL